MLRVKDICINPDNSYPRQTNICVWCSGCVSVYKRDGLVIAWGRDKIVSDRNRIPGHPVLYSCIIPVYLYRDMTGSHLCLISETGFCGAYTGDRYKPVHMGPEVLGPDRIPVRLRTEIGWHASIISGSEVQTGNQIPDNNCSIPDGPKMVSGTLNESFYFSKTASNSLGA